MSVNKAERISIMEAYSLWQHSPEQAREVMLKQEPDTKRVDALIAGFVRINKTQQNKQKIPSWW